MHMGITSSREATLSRVFVVVMVLTMMLAAGVSPATAQENDAKAGEAKVEQSGGTEDGEESAEVDLAQQARNPTAALTMMQIVTRYNPNFYNLQDADQLSLVVMPVIPFKTGKLQHIARITMPFVLVGPDWGTLEEDETSEGIPPNYVPTAEKTGVGDTALFDLLIFPAPWKNGKIAAGLSAIVPTASDPALGSEKWSLGPAFGALVQSGDLLVGGIALANFSVAGDSDRQDVKALTIQPFGSYGLSNGWSVELSEMNFTYDMNSDTWASLPLGARVGKMTKFGKLPVRLYGDVEYNVANSGVAPQWTFRFAIVPLL